MTPQTKDKIRAALKMVLTHMGPDTVLIGNSDGYLRREIIEEALLLLSHEQAPASAVGMRSAEEWMMEIRTYARDGRPYAGGTPGWVLTPLEIQNVIEHIQQDAAHDALERAAKECDKVNETIFMAFSDGISCNLDAADCARNIRNLKTDGGKE